MDDPKPAGPTSPPRNEGRGETDSSSGRGLSPHVEDLTPSLDGWTKQAPPNSRDSSSGYRRVQKNQSPPIFSKSQLVAGRYKISRFFSRGGMGEVYEAEDLDLREWVALKTVRADIAENSLAVERFRTEIQLARKVTHPNVCRIFDIGHHRISTRKDGETTETQVTFLTMELLDGESLEERIRSKGRLTPEEALPIIRQIGAALDAAHLIGIVHRDFKSQNVILVEPKDGSGPSRAVVTDFGLARPQLAEAQNTISREVDIVGTPAYLAPEQVAGREIRPAADIYALGIVMYEMVTGSPPFRGDTPLATAVARLIERPVSPRSIVPGLDSHWEETILRCLELDPSSRPKSAREILSLLEGRAPLPSASESGGKAQRSRSFQILSLFLLALVIAVYFLSPSDLKKNKAPLPGPSTSAARGKTTTPPRRSIAVLGFKNLTGQTQTAWLATALSEMLAMELAAGEKLRIVPGENIARMKVDLSLGDQDSFSRETLARIRGHLGADLVVVGSYFDAGEKKQERIRLDLRLQNAASGETIASVTDTASGDDLLSLVSRVGARLRQRLDLSELSASETGAALASLPSNPQAAKLYAEGLEKLRLYDAQGARAALRDAAGSDPKSPFVHVALATALNDLGFEVDATAEAKQAFDLSAALSREERLTIEGFYRLRRGEIPKAIESYRSAWALYPDNLEHGLRLADAQRLGGLGAEALATVDALHQLAEPAGSDPRIDIEEALAAQSLSDSARQKTAASRAILKGTARGQKQVVARARFQEAWAAIDAGDLVRGRSSAEESRRLSAESGDRGAIARATSTIGVVLQTEGDLAGARRMFEESLAIRRSIGERRAQGWVLQDLGSLLTAQGDLAGAKRRFDESLAISGELGYQRQAAFALYGLGELYRTEGDAASSRKAHNQAIAIRTEIGDKVLAAKGRVAVAALLLDDGQLDAASDLARQVAEELKAVNSREVEATARLVLAEVLLAQKKWTDAKDAIDRATSLTEKSRNRELRLAIRLAGARALAATGMSHDVDEALRGVDALRIEAETAGLYTFSLETRLALGEIELQAGRTAEARGGLEALEKEAGQKGFGFVARRAAAARSRTGH